MMRTTDEKPDQPPVAAVRKMRASDVSSAVSILRESFGAPSWTEESLMEWASNGRAWVAESNGCVAGLLIAQIASDELEILDLAVQKGHRRRGVATELLRAVLDWACSAGARNVYLEVRASNEVGFSFYMHRGFHVRGRRPNYYRNPLEDAVLMTLHNPETIR